MDASRLRCFTGYVEGDHRGPWNMSRNYSITLQIWRIGISVVLQIGWQRSDAAIMAGIVELGGALGLAIHFLQRLLLFPTHSESYVLLRALGNTVSRGLGQRRFTGCIVPVSAGRLDRSVWESTGFKSRSVN